MARNKALANLPWYIDEDQSQRGNITIKGADGRTVCRVPFDSPARGEAGLADDHDRAMLIVEAVRAYAEAQGVA